MTHILNYQTIGWRAAVLRQRAGLNQIESAKKAGIAPKTWRNLEDGKPCRDATIFAVAEAFGCSISWLIDKPYLERKIDAEYGAAVAAIKEEVRA